MGHTPKSSVVSLCIASAVLSVATAGALPAQSARQTPQRSVQTEPEIVLGMSTALTGPSGQLGLAMKLGVEAALKEVNATGGIKGHRVRLVALDDGYEPARTAPNMERLVDVEQVLAVVGNVGTPTAVAALPIVNSKKTLFFGAFTGAGVLRKNPPDRYVVNYRASYAEETDAMVAALIQEGKLLPQEIAFFTQRDAYGDAGFAGGIAALRRHGLSADADIIHARYERNTLAVENGLAEIMQSDVLPKAVICVGAYAPCARFIKLAHQYGLNAVFLNVSFVGTVPLAKALDQDGDGVIVTQVVPHYESTLPAVQQYRRALVALDGPPQTDFGSLEGYLATRVLLLALERCPATPDRETLVDSLERLNDFDLGVGEPLSLSHEQHQACHRIWPTVLRGGRAIPFQWSDLAGLIQGSGR